MIRTTAIQVLLGLLCAASLAGCGSSSAQGGETLSLLLQADSGVTSNFIWITTLSTVDGEAFFFASDPVSGSEPWVSDGTSEGTRLLKDIMPGPGNSSPTPLFEHAFVAFNGLVYFAANDGVSGLELWRTDGTEAGTELAVDLIPGPEGYQTIILRASVNRLYISTFDGGVLTEVWVLEAPL